MAQLLKLRTWHEEHERHISTVSLVTGFLFDSFALHRIDSPAVNGWLIFNLLLVLISIILINREENLYARRESWKRFWLFNLMQFGLGAILGGSFRFYLRSGTIAGSWPFLLILVAALLFNEFLRQHYERMIFQLSFLYLGLFVLSIFMLPVVVKSISAWVFILSGALSLVVFWLFLKLLKKYGREIKKHGPRTIWAPIIVIFVIINLLYFTNLIPPIPLSLKDAGIYHAVSLDSAGNYQVSGEKENWFERFFHFRQNLHWLSGEPLYAYTAIYSPGSLNTEIIHEWQRKNEFGEWVTQTRIPLYLSGGRDSGFRTFSTKYNITTGDWRVNVKTLRGQLLGRINFTVIQTQTAPTLTTSVKN